MRTGNLIGEAAGGDAGRCGGGGAGVGGARDPPSPSSQARVSGEGQDHPGERQGWRQELSACSASVAPRGRASFMQHQTFPLVEFAHIPLGQFFEFTLLQASRGMVPKLTSRILCTGKAVRLCASQTTDASRKSTSPPFRKEAIFVASGLFRSNKSRSAKGMGSLEGCLILRVAN